MPRFWLSLKPSLHLFQPHGVQNITPVIDPSMALKCVPCVCLLGLTGFCAWHGAGQISLPAGSGGMVGAGCRLSASISVRCKWYGQGAGDVCSPLESSQSEKPMDFAPEGCPGTNAPVHQDIGSSPRDDCTCAVEYPSALKVE